MFSGTKGLQRLPHKEHSENALKSVQIRREINQEDASRYMGHGRTIK